MEATITSKPKAETCWRCHGRGERVIDHGTGPSRYGTRDRRYVHLAFETRTCRTCEGHGSVPTGYLSWDEYRAEHAA